MEKEGLTEIIKSSTPVSGNTGTISEDELKMVLNILENMEKASDSLLKVILEKSRTDPFYLTRLHDSEIFYEKTEEIIKRLLPKNKNIIFIPSTIQAVNRYRDGSLEREVCKLNKEYKIKNGDIIEAPLLPQRERNGERRADPCNPKRIVLPDERRDGYFGRSQRNGLERRKEKVEQAYAMIYNPQIYNPQESTVKFTNNIGNAFGYCPVCSNYWSRLSGDWKKMYPMLTLEPQHSSRALAISYCDKDTTLVTRN